MALKPGSWPAQLERPIPQRYLAHAAVVVRGHSLRCLAFHYYAYHWLAYACALSRGAPLAQGFAPVHNDGRAAPEGPGSFANGRQLGQSAPKRYRRSPADDGLDLPPTGEPGPSPFR